MGSNLGFYLFYNHTLGNAIINEKEEYYGCSYISTHALKKSISKKGNVRFSCIHPIPAKPFYHFFHNEGGSGISDYSPNSPSGKFNDVMDFFKKQGMEIDEEFVSKLRFYNKEEIAEQNIEWDKITMDRFQDRNLSIKIKSEEIKFKPKYKLILSPSPKIPDDNPNLKIEVGGDKKLEKTQIEEKTERLIMA